MKKSELKSMIKSIIRESDTEDISKMKIDRETLATIKKAIAPVIKKYEKELKYYKGIPKDANRDEDDDLVKYNISILHGDINGVKKRLDAADTYGKLNRVFYNMDNLEFSDDLWEALPDSVLKLLEQL